MFLKNLDLRPKNYIDDQSFLIMCTAPRLICDDSMTSKMARKFRNKNVITLSSKVRYRHDATTTVGIITSFLMNLF